MKTKKVKIGVVGVDSGQLLICDPCYIAGEYLGEGKHTLHQEIYKHKDGSLWQFCYKNQKPTYSNVNKFPGTYLTVIEKYGKNPNDLIKSGEFTESELDPDPYVKEGEFSYNGICRLTIDKQYGQINFKLGHAGAGVAFRSGFGDGLYDVYAEIGDYGELGKRVKRVIIELIT